ncbi:Transcription elongation factor [Parasponia andersonii]|uniref:Transcription elongation factor 1 homolog n=1 Tax=Parasponia andersonii TaxID=3476 RepID=A0A2P5AN65_PARAD|nr:Transcription elongation factor [Parasponia andersonii]
MGKRKSRKLKPATKKKIKLETTFDCPFCNRKDSVECELDNKEKKYRYGTASCWVCEEGYSTRINALTEPIDL